MFLTIDVPEDAMKGWMSRSDLAEVLIEAFKKATARHGHWIVVGNNEYKCSECGAVHVWGGIPFNKCQNCGAEMNNKIVC